jgi:hypothetical protein
MAILSIFLIGQVVWADDGRLYFIQPAAVDKNTYVLSTQIDAMKVGFDLAVKAFNAKFSKTKCKPDITVNFDLHTDASLVEEVSRISNLPGKKVMIGFTRTNFARLAAHGSVGTDMIGISSAAISDELRDINPNFISVGTAYQNHWKATATGLKTLNCTPGNTLGIFAYKDVWSGYYKKSFLSDGYKMVADIDEFSSVPDIDNKVKCIFLGVSAPRSIQPLSELITKKWPGVIIGTHDWTYFSAEVRELLAEHKKRITRVYTTIIWHRNDTDESKIWANKYFGKTTVVEPFHVSVYDSTIIALNYLCRDQNVLEFNADKWKKFGTLRTYQGMSQSGNLETAINFVELPLVEWN